MQGSLKPGAQHEVMNSPFARALLPLAHLTHFRASLGHATVETPVTLCFWGTLLFTTVK